MTNKIVAGVDIGGSHITTALVDLAGKGIYHETMNRQPVNAKGDVGEIIYAWCSTLRQCFQSFNLAPGKIGIAIPGPFDYESGVSFIKNQDKYDALYQLNVKQLIANELGIALSDIKLKNDAVCFLQGEAFNGSAAGCKYVLGLTLGTGLGSAILQDGEVVDADKWCSPFKTSIAEDYISTRWFLKQYTELTGRKVTNVKQLVALISTDSNVQNIFNEFGENLAAFLIENFGVNMPQVVVLGGNISNAIDCFLPAMQSKLQQHHLLITICQATHSENAALVGAAACWKEPHFIEIGS